MNYKFIITIPFEHYNSEYHGRNILHATLKCPTCWYKITFDEVDINNQKDDQYQYKCCEECKYYIAYKINKTNNTIDIYEY